MRNLISELSPEYLWKHFYELTQIPHPSKEEQKIIEYVLKFGKRLGLDTLKDDVGNVIIRKEATPGKENCKGVILQGHLDMVPQKNIKKVHNFSTDPLDVFIEDGWVTANDTTLGADNGIGVAAALAVLESDSIKHGPLEVLFSVDEETGMTGAFGLKSGLLQGDILLNLDSEDEGELFVGCAGGTNVNISLPYQVESVDDGFVAFKISLTGLKGGHSGLDINMGRGNANKLLFRFLKEVNQVISVRLASINGGSLRNAIPREAFAIVCLASDDESLFLDQIEKRQSVYAKEYADVELDMSLKAEECEMPLGLINLTTQDNLINAIQGCINGVVSMDNSINGLVETSSNLAIVKSEGNSVLIKCLVRSSVESAKENVESAIESVFKLAGAKVMFDGQYPGWEPNLASPILGVMTTIYKEKYGVIPNVKAIHAGLECGILGATYPHWDMISFGPTIRFPHSPDEKVNIESVRKFWDYLVATLECDL